MGGVSRKPKMMQGQRFGAYSASIRQMTAEQRQQEIERLQKEAQEARRQEVLRNALDSTSTARGDTTIDTVQNKNFFTIGAQRYKKVETPIEKLQRGFNEKCKLWKQTFIQYQAKMKEKGRSTTHEDIDEQIQDLRNQYADATKEWEWAQANAIVEGQIHSLEACIKELDQPTVQRTHRRPKMSINIFG